MYVNVCHVCHVMVEITSELIPSSQLRRRVRRCQSRYASWRGLVRARHQTSMRSARPSSTPASFCVNSCRLGAKAPPRNRRKDGTSADKAEDNAPQTSPIKIEESIEREPSRRRSTTSVASSAPRKRQISRELRSSRSTSRGSDVKARSPNRVSAGKSTLRSTLRSTRKKVVKRRAPMPPCQQEIPFALNRRRYALLVGSSRDTASAADRSLPGTQVLLSISSR